MVIPIFCCLAIAHFCFMKNEADLTQPITSVLIVDDSSLVVQRLTAALIEILPDTELIFASTGTDALEIVETTRPLAVLLDIHLPDISGIEVLKKIKTNHANTVVIMLTNNSEPHNKTTCLENGADGFYDKTTEFEKAIEQFQMVATQNMSSKKKIHPTEGQPSIEWNFFNHLNSFNKS